MRRRFLCLVTAGAFALGSLSVACGDDDSGAGPNQPDSGTDTGPGPGPGPGPLPDGGDAGCTFAGYVIDLVSKQTTSSSQPDPTLGQQCVDTTDQAAFAPLFP